MEKKQLIMENALKLFAKKGFKATSVQNITDACGISKGAFYLSFKSKEELIIALINHFIAQFITDLDYVVKSVEDDDELLYEFYYTIFHTFEKHSNSAKIFMKEQLQSFNEKFIMQGHSYDQEVEQIIEVMIERLYGEEMNDRKHDLIYCVKGFIKTYAELFIFYNMPLDLDKLAQSLAEKTMILAQYTTIPFVDSELYSLQQKPILQEITREEILKVVEENIQEIEEGLEKDSLVILQGEVVEASLPPAIIKGLIGNIRPHPYCKRSAYLLSHYFELDDL